MNKAVTPPSLPFIDLAAQRRRLGPALEEAILNVVRHGAYILGPEVEQCEAELAAFCGAKHVVSCSNGTDALSLVLMAKGVGPGQAVLCPSFTYTATAEVVARAGAVPIFVDVHEHTFDLDAEHLGAAIAKARQLGLDPVGVIPVDLFGQAADYDSIAPICEREGLWMLCDAAQSFGGTYGDKRLGTFGLATTTSFFPAKPLGCYGDGGAIFTEDDDLAAELRSLRFHGLNPDRTDHVRIGITGRLDTIQAAVLLQKLRIFPDEIEARGRIAARYSEALADVATPPPLRAGSISAWAQYTIKVRAEQRDALAASLRAQGIPTAIYYSKPVHQLAAYRHYPTAGNGLPVTEALSRQVISLPMHPYLDGETQDRIILAVRSALAGA
ncbi:DegT/DnrJ/EryC1/StrS aminotransferase family protein [Enterovirga sp.]|jgi:dTDP-4-amino-4,6-dideoxygalactose transaminase|uniref:DegT/DnrJ/EryC1/StrS family aminotransferase n=1 Tax=Enterovirga sp. TaxID=2026350 RepID=UPI002615AC32|nr:DegT/DnrJ/EryC1/StrS aminotransferase family protein [Enterovirga sp.]MDB5591106.1 aminotransferase DegT [Enterovirga sp.]